MKRFWTSAHLKGNQAYIRGYIDGKPFAEKQWIKPYMFEEHKDGDFKTIINDIPCIKKDFKSISDARTWIKGFEGVANKKIHGLQHFLYTHLNDEFAGTVDFDTDMIARGSIDIETDSSGSFPNVETADKELTAITLTHRKNGVRKIAMFGLKPYKVKHPEAAYQMCRDETDMLEKFLELWNDPEWTPDILTGWYIEGFDIPYIVRRIGRVLGTAKINLLSPWRIVNEREISRGQTVGASTSQQTVYEIFGISILDYLELYKKFSFKNQESFKLDHIAFVELGKKKIDYSEYGSLDGLYRMNFELYMDYNLTDTLLVDELDEKMGLIDLVLTFAYDAKITFNDTMTTTRPWDVIIHNYLLGQGYVVPQSLGFQEDKSIVGGYVKEPVPGLYEGVVNYDFDSLYPHVIMGWNISPETLIGRVDFDAISSHKRGSFERDVEMHRPAFEAQDAILAGNGCLFKKDKIGFLPSLMDSMYQDRVLYKNKMKDAKKRLQAVENEILHRLSN
jgi:DNA polymerase elongation subunit (family B)